MYDIRQSLLRFPFQRGAVVEAQQARGGHVNERVRASARRNANSLHLLQVHSIEGCSTVESAEPVGTWYTVKGARKEANICSMNSKSILQLCLAPLYTLSIPNMVT
jgi:hypothetical protein